MNLIRNVFALIGVVVVVLGTVLFVTSQDLQRQFDPEAPRVYRELVENILVSRNGADATIWKVPVTDDLSPEEVEETMKFVANEHNFSLVGELPLSMDVAAKRGEEYRFIKIFLFCDSLVAAEMIDYRDSFSAYLPCRITLIEDKQGKFWLTALNMDMMIYGGEPLPPQLKEQALRVKQIILDIMQRGASGEF